MSNSWAFSQLNQLTPSPGVSPQNGPDAVAQRDDLSLSFPCDGTVLQAQLEAWTSVAFDFDSAADDSSPANSSSLFTDAAKALDEDHAVRDRYRVNLASAPGTYAFDSGVVEPPSDRDLDALLSTGLGPRVAALDPYASLVDPTLHLPTCSNAIASTSSASAIVNAFAGLPNSLFPSPSAPDGSSSSSSSKAAAPVVTSTSSNAMPKKAAAAPRALKKAAAATVETPVAQEVDLVDGDDEANRVAIEEDKRRRNTAASARFRIKKKQREQALESTAKELRDRVAALEAEVAGLRTENGWLRGLITDKPKNPVEDADLKLLLSGSKKRGREEDQEHVDGANKSVVAIEA
ncbi:BZ3500_MvSof-1268-A1-R1_Chr3-1g06100 [Microbotryum saponariae]|uniref:BZ3500_MvSof-1268-A1-R1_Chr3-1g06100 protein n=1 Tax=Microbotryum saponariae TaxID=289078 RepID=A0A2X0LWY3_9BASI|nr:BZ3500_MvSof-1268-A1-R1_Chr3-1g06100 [Microbotryum saponariae]SDA03963.1 BZ3501_MvSof-1269-A2-R1_Chr3-2g05785 [Microbotryum saponariae]